MNKEEFLRQLELLLKDIPQEEREEALRFYAEYFSEAGPSQEQAVLNELVSPERVAASIKAALPGFENEGKAEAAQPESEIPLPIYARVKKEPEQPEGAAQYGQPQGTAQYAQNQGGPQYAQQANPSQGYGPQYNQPGNYSQRYDRGSMNILLILLAVLSFPIWGGVAIAALAVLFTIPVVGAALLFAGVVSVIAVFAVGIVNIGLLVSGGVGTGLLAVGLLFLGAASGLLIAGIGAGVLFWMIPALWHVFKKYIWNPILGRRTAE